MRELEEAASVSDDKLETIAKDNSIDLLTTANQVNSGTSQTSMASSTVVHPAKTLSRLSHTLRPTLEKSLHLNLGSFALKSLVVERGQSGQARY